MLLRHRTPPEDCAVVGNGGGELGRRHGPSIDAFAHVARFNNFHLRPLPVEDYGARTTAYVTIFYPTVTPVPVGQVAEVFCPLPIGDEKWFGQGRPYNYEPHAGRAAFDDITSCVPEEIFAELYRLRPYPTTGFAFLWWMRAVYGKVRREQIFGFDFFKDGCLWSYWGDKVVSPDARAQYGHDFEDEARLAKDLYGV